MTLVTLALVCLALASLWLYSKWRHSYWASQGVTTPPFLPILGHIHHKFSTKGQLDFVSEAYHKYGGSKFCGLYEFFRPMLMVGDPELLKHIFVKDFDHFKEKLQLELPNEEDRVMAEMLPFRKFEEWKRMRAAMSPIFSSGKLKGMFPLVCDKADALVDFSVKEARRKSVVDLKFNFGRFTLDTIASCAFGIECNSLVDEDAEFPKKAGALFSISRIQGLKMLATLTFPTIAKCLGIRFTRPEADFFQEVARHTLEERLKGGAGQRGDFLDLLLEAREGEDEESSRNRSDFKSKLLMQDSSIVAQSVLFLVTGYETTASTLGFASYLLAKNPDAQQKLREEIQDLVHEEGDITYQGVMEAKFLEATLMETLRLFPPTPYINRLCTKSYRLPGTTVTLQPGDKVHCPVWCLHHDPEHWPGPEMFRPERFLPENRDEVKSFTHVPFGMGPKNCIGRRFALMEAKVVLAKLLLASELKLAPGHEEMKLDSGLGLVRASEGVKVLLKPIKAQ